MGTLFPEADNKNFKVDYNADSGLYRVAYFKEREFVDWCQFVPYAGSSEVKCVYIVYGDRVDDNHNILETWVEAILDNAEQADACAEYLHLTNKQSGVIYWSGGCGLPIDERNYIKKLKELKKNI